MKKTSAIIAVVLTIFSLLYFSDTALAGKALVPNGLTANPLSITTAQNTTFSVADRDGQDLRVEVKRTDGASFHDIGAMINSGSSASLQQSGNKLLQAAGADGSNDIFDWRVVYDGGSVNADVSYRITVTQ